METCFLFMLYILWRIFYWGQVLPSSGEFFWNRKHVKMQKDSLRNTFRVTG